MENKKKKILILPGIFDHIDLIKEARKRNFEITTCDNQPNNIGHIHADHYANIDILDYNHLKDFVLSEKFDFIAGFSTDIGALAADYLNKQIGLILNSNDAVPIMTNKKKFRQFLKNNGFYVPEFKILKTIDDLNSLNIKFPAIIKPVDRAGSKGVSLVTNLNEVKSRISEVLGLSFSGEIIIEEYINSKFKHIHGDALVQNGKIIFCCLGDQHFGNGNMDFSPIATIFPSKAPQKIKDQIKENLQLFISKVGYRNGAINIEVRVDSKNNIYFIELAPRHGGNFIAKTISYFCNTDLISSYLDIITGKKVKINSKPTPNSFTFQFSLRSYVEGIYSSTSLNLDNYIIVDSFQIKKKGDAISVNNGPDNIISVYIIKTTNYDLILELILNTNKYFQINLL